MKRQMITIAIISAMASICHAGWFYENYKDGVKIGGKAISFNQSMNQYLTDMQFKYVLSDSECNGLVNIPSDFNGLPLVKIDGLSFKVNSGNSGFIVPETVKEISSVAFVAGPNCYQSLWRYSWGWSRDKVSANAEWYPSVLFNAKLYLNIYFKGDKPTVVNPFVSACSYEGECRDCVFWTSRLDFPQQFLNGNCWVVEGTSGWETNTYFQGGLVQYYAAKANILPVRRKFVESQVISLSCENETATMFYTLDGSEPVTNETENCFRYEAPFLITTDTTVKALAYVSAYSSTVTSVQKYVKATAAPVVLQPTSSTFYQSNEKVVLSCSTPNAVIRYTTDGSAVTLDSAIYDSPFSISETTTIRACAYCDGIEESDELNETFVRDWHTVDVPVIVPGSKSFVNVPQEVSISCDTDGATILYTTDGSDPAVNGRKYKLPFNIYQSCTVRAIAVKYDWRDSEEATAIFTRSESLSEAANLYGYTMESDETYPWTVVTDVSHDGVSSVRSGAIGNDGMTYLQASVRKAGTVSFWWKAQCEDAEVEDDETYWYDYGAFLVDGVEMARIAGHDTGWQFVSVDVAGGGKHTLRWEYSKDGATSYAPDCVWLDQVQWAPADGSGFTMTSPEPVPYSWLSTYGFGGMAADFETAANAPSGKRDGGGKALSVWQDYVAGTDPTNVTSRFSAKIEMRDGAPLVTWEPDLNENGTKSERLYKVYGSESLDGGGEWQYPTNSLHRFFKVTVEMP